MQYSARVELHAIVTVQSFTVPMQDPTLQCANWNPEPLAGRAASVTTEPWASSAEQSAQTDGRNYDLDQVTSGTLNLAATINGVVTDRHGDPIVL